MDTLSASVLRDRYCYYALILINLSEKLHYLYTENSYTNQYKRIKLISILKSNENKTIACNDASWGLAVPQLLR